MKDIRRQQHFDNFYRAFVVLREIQERGVDSLTQLEKVSDPSVLEKGF